MTAGSASDRPNPHPGIGTLVALFGLLAGVVLVIYGRVLPSFFVDADFDVLARAESARDLREALASGPPAPAYQPLTAASYWLSNAWSQRDATGFRLANLLLHAGNAWLVAVLTWQLLASRAGAAFAGLCFALTPAGAECAGWIAGRPHLLVTGGVLLATVGWLRFCQGRGGGAALVATGGLGIALLAGDAGLVTPALLAATAILAPRPVRGGPAATEYGGRTRTWIDRGLALVGMLILTGIYLAVRSGQQAGLGGTSWLGPHRSLEPAVMQRFLADASQLVLAPGNPWLSFACIGLVGILGLPLVLDLTRDPTPAARAGSEEGRALEPPAPRLGRALAAAFALAACGYLICLLPAANRVILDPATGENSRFAYLPAAFGCAFLGLLAGAAELLRHRGRAWICAGILGCLAIHLVGANERWRAASTEAEALLSALRDRAAARPETQFVFIHGLPIRRRGAFVFQSGIAAAVRKFARPDLQFPPNGALSAADWQTHAAARRADPNLHPEVLLLRWDSARKALINP